MLSAGVRQRWPVMATDNLSMTMHFRPEHEDMSHGLRKPEQPNWWKRCTCYQIWPTSFKDSNGDGIGDIPGILSKLDYLKSLGIDVVWVSPMYASPQVDMGYDISDYESVDPRFGTMDDMDKLITGLHERGLRLILDLVVNHTSDQHHWFKESRKSKDNAYSDFYIWKDPKIDKDGQRQPPNNWGSLFGGSAWEYVEERNQYYLHLFTRQQPDLNWERSKTRKAIHNDALKFWFDKGVDGFRVDTAGIYSKDQAFPEGTVTEGSAPYGGAFQYCKNGPRIHEFYQEIRSQVLDHYKDPMMVGELMGSTSEETLEYISSDKNELSMVFDFDFATLGGVHRVPIHEVTGFRLPELKTALQKTQDFAMNPKAWSTSFLENHDISRSISRYGSNSPEYHDRAAKVLAMLLCTLSGTLFVYQGQEIGMTNIPESWTPHDLKDVVAIRYWERMVREHPHDKELLDRAWKGIVAIGRDNARTPVQWSAEERAGFTEGEPWMRINENYTDINVADQLTHEDSVWHFWRRLIKLRKEHEDIFVSGNYKVHDFDNEKTWTFEKKSAHGETSFVVLNFSEEECEWTLPDCARPTRLELVVGNVSKPAERLQPWEGRIYREKQ